LKVEQQVCVPAEFDGHTLGNNLRLDMLAEELVIVENKAVVEMCPLFESQRLTYLKLSRKRLGFLINYNVPLIRSGIQRFVI
jgi:GxxExxY protein